jgi:hypothetical protein
LLLLWIVAAAGVIVAAMALMRVRRLSRRVERLMESYWDLRHEHGQLQARVDRLDPARTGPAATPASGAGTFIPVSSLKR